MTDHTTENGPMQREVYIVQWVNEPMPKETWSGDRFWPHIEVYEDYAQALLRWGALKDEGIPARFSIERPRPIPPEGGSDD